MTQLVLIRHGQSAWNLENRFTGWWDADLTPRGEEEARNAGRLLAGLDADFRIGFTSVQTRAIRTMWLALTEMQRAWLPVEKHWRLNERHYGSLTGLDKAETAAAHGEAQVHVWRRSYDIAPPPLAAGSPYDLSGDPRYRGITVPDTESLKTTLERVLPFWADRIAPQLADGHDTLVAAHGNSLRALMKHLFRLDEEAITSLEIPTGNPLLIALDDRLAPVAVRYLDAGRAQPLPPVP